MLSPLSSDPLLTRSLAALQVSRPLSLLAARARESRDEYCDLRFSCIGDSSAGSSMLSIEGVAPHSCVSLLWAAAIPTQLTPPTTLHAHHATRLGLPQV